jgi:hypothetical protein
MAYTIDYMKSGRIEWTDDLRDTLESAKAVDKKAVEDGTAESIEIRNERGDQVFQFPRARVVP